MDCRKNNWEIFLWILRGTMASSAHTQTLEHMLDQVAEAAEGSERLSVADVLEVIGRRSFGPLLLVAGLITLAPVIGDIPGVPTIIGMLVLLVSAQLIVKRKHVWLPQFLLRRSVAKSKVDKALHWSRKPARWTDRFLKPRLTRVVEGGTFYLIAGICIAIAGLMPVMEVVPFTANAAGAALTSMGLSLMAHDGLWALVAIMIVAGAVGLLIYYFI
jgi:hypothetical protein